MDSIREKINSYVEKHSEQWVGIREYLHRYPELSFQEEHTQNFICDQLDKMNISYERGNEDLRYVIAIINKDAERTIALRADIDALPITEENDSDYKSLNQGVMHACGHDVHTSCLLGALDILSRYKSELNHRIVAVFQPAEEKLPGGASMLLKQDIPQKYKPEWIVGQHVHPPLAVGSLGFKSGPYMASADEIRIKIKGVGGHAAAPNECVDSIYLASLVIQNLQGVISRFRNPIIPSVLTFGKINSEGGATNVIPPSVSIEGTFRSMDDNFRNEALDLIEKVVHQSVQPYGAEAEVDILRGYPVLENDENTTNMAQEYAEEFLGSEQVKPLPIRLSAEDFASYTKIIPGCFYRLGTGFSDRENYPVHHPKFDVHPKAIGIGAGFMAYLCWRYSSNAV